ncbi:MAG: hypothetical protein ISR93_02860 [SAR324 cluster bacterium]|nr:hypothetical protein [SAR324 cluster bacterium]
MLDQLAKPLFNAFVSPLESIPPEGLSGKKLKKSCIFEVTLRISNNQHALQITSERSEKRINSSLQIDGSSPSQIESGILQAILQSIPQSKSEICQRFSDKLPQHCEAERTIAVIYESSRDNPEEDVLGDARGVVWEELDEIIQEMDLLKPSGSRQILQPQTNLASTLDSAKIFGAVSFQIMAQREKKKSLMWAGMVDVQVKIKVYKYKNGAWNQVGSYTTLTQRRPVRKWAKKPEMLRTQYQSAVHKMIKKWDKNNIYETISNLKN